MDSYDMFNTRAACLGTTTRGRPRVTRRGGESSRIDLQARAAVQLLRGPGPLCPGLGLPDLLRRCHGSRVIGLEGRWRKHAAHPMFLNRPPFSTAFDPMPRGPRQRCPEGAASNFVSTLPGLPCISAPEICSQSRTCALQNNGRVAGAGRVDWLAPSWFSKQSPASTEELRGVRMTVCPPVNVCFNDGTGEGRYTIPGKMGLFKPTHEYLCISINLWQTTYLWQWLTAGS